MNDTQQSKSRKELKEEYKQRKPLMGVYQIRNAQNGKVLIGSSTTISSVWNSLQFQLEAGNYINRPLQEEWNEFGKENFVFEILHELTVGEDSTTDPRTDLQALKDMTIEEVQPFGDRGYH